MDRWVRSIEAMLEVFDAICKAVNEFGPWVSYAIAGVLVSPLAVLMWFVQYRQFSPYWATLWVVIWGAILMGLVALLWLD